MAHQPASDFDELAAAFADYGTTLSGYLRYQITRRNLQPYVSAKKLQVLDVGGGSGGDTAWLAEKGHKVTYLEPSTEQRRYAERRFLFLLTDKSRPRITIGGAVMDELSPRSQQFDVVLVHAVAMYQDDPHQFLRHAFKFVKPGGLISILEKGYYGTELQNVRSNDFANLARLHRTGRSINHLKRNVHAFKPEEIERLLRQQKFEIESWSGVRLLIDDIGVPVDTLKPARLKQILEIEYQHGHHQAIRGQGQLLHFIARKQI